MGVQKQLSGTAAAASPIRLTSGNATNDLSFILDGNEADIVVYRITDEALEGALHVVEGKPGSFTLSTCTFLTICPGP